MAMLRNVGGAVRHAASRRAARYCVEQQRRGNMDEIFDAWRRKQSEKVADAVPPTQLDTTWLGGIEGRLVAGQRKKARKHKASSAERLPRVDYLEQLEEAYGAKESWHRADEAFMRRMIPVLCRKIDDMRERTLDLHRQQRAFRLQTREELKKIPLYKREAWMSPDLTRSMLVDDLGAKGYLGENGQLLDVQQLLDDHKAKLLEDLRAQGLLADNPSAAAGAAAQLPAGDGGNTPPPAPPAPTAHAVTAPEGAAPGADVVPAAPYTPPVAFSTAEPLIIDPLLQDVHAPEYNPPPPQAPIRSNSRFKKAPSAKSIETVMADHPVARDVDKIWVHHPSTTIQADLDPHTRRVTCVKPVGGRDNFEDPSPRRYAENGWELGRDDERARRRASPAEGVEAAGEDDGAEVNGDGDAEEDSHVDPVMRQLRKEKLRRKQHRSATWSKLEDPKVKPGNAIHDAVMATSRDLDKAGVSLEGKFAVMEEAGTAAEMTVDLTQDYPAFPERGPDAVDKYVAAAQDMDRATLRDIEQERAAIRRTLRPQRVGGAQFTPTMPKHEDALAYRHSSTTDEGVWYYPSREPGAPGVPIPPSPKRWPKRAVLVPWDIHEAAERGVGYAAVKAKQEILRLTANEDDE